MSEKTLCHMMAPHGSHPWGYLVMEHRDDIRTNLRVVRPSEFRRNFRPGPST